MTFEILIHIFIKFNLFRIFVTICLGKDVAKKLEVGKKYFLDNIVMGYGCAAEDRISKI